MITTIAWPPYRLFPYERRLAIREATSLGANSVSVTESGLEISGVDQLRLRDATTYSESVTYGEKTFATAQHEVESEHLGLLGRGSTRQATRYWLHGVHEYKGKFNPQLVRALMNATDADAQSLIDPFVGSGTGLIEALRLNRHALGIDLSPMATFVSRTKVQATEYRDRGRLIRDLRLLAEETSDALVLGQESGIPLTLPESYSTETQSYLQSWFTPPAYAGISHAIAAVWPRRRGIAGRLCLLALSAIVRDVSLQLPEDLRVRRRPEPFVAPPLAPLFTAGVDRIAMGLAEMGKWRARSTAEVVLADSGDINSYRSRVLHGRLQIVTSPPYATALPYIDTDRLSLMALGLMDRRSLGSTEASLTGSREWNRATARAWTEALAQNHSLLPESVLAVCRAIQAANSQGKVGFRRADKPALLYRYFAQMADTIGVWAEVLAASETATVVVGGNRTTTATGETVLIDTPSLTADIGASRGFDVLDIIELETWPRYGLHHQNAVRSESAVVLGKPQQ